MDCKFELHTVTGECSPLVVPAGRAVHLIDVDYVFPEGHPGLNDNCTHLQWTGSQDDCIEWINTPRGAMVVYDAMRTGDVYIHIHPVSVN